MRTVIQLISICYSFVKRKLRLKYAKLSGTLVSGPLREEQEAES